MSALMSPIELAFQQFEEATKETRSIRKSLIRQLKGSVDVLKLNPDTESSKVTEAKMCMFTTLNGMLKDEESVAERNVKLRMSRKESDDNSNIAASIGALLKAVSLNNIGGNASATNAKDLESAKDKLNEMVTNKGITITEGELEECADKASVE